MIALRGGDGAESTTAEAGGDKSCLSPVFLPMCGRWLRASMAAMEMTRRVDGSSAGSAWSKPWWSGGAGPVPGDDEGRETRAITGRPRLQPRLRMGDGRACRAAVTGRPDGCPVAICRPPTGHGRLGGPRMVMTGRWRGGAGSGLGAGGAGVLDLLESRRSWILEVLEVPSVNLSSPPSCHLRTLDSEVQGPIAMSSGSPAGLWVSRYRSAARSAPGDGAPADGQGCWAVVRGARCAHLTMRGGGRAVWCQGGGCGRPPCQVAARESVRGVGLHPEVSA